MKMFIIMKWECNFWFSWISYYEDVVTIDPLFRNSYGHLKNSALALASASFLYTIQPGYIRPSHESDYRICNVLLQSYVNDLGCYCGFGRPLLPILGFCLHVSMWMCIADTRSQQMTKTTGAQCSYRISQCCHKYLCK